MLTPRGVAAPGRRTRRRARVLGVLVALAVLGTVAFAGWRHLADSDDAAPATVTPSRSCSTPPVTLPRKLPEPSAISVAVANGTETSGLAVETADELVARGFVVPTIGNTAKPVKSGVAEVRYGRNDLASAVVVASFVPGSQLVETRDADIALWLGPDFDGVADADEADVDAVALPAGEPVCRRQ